MVFGLFERSPNPRSFGGWADQGGSGKLSKGQNFHFLVFTNQLFSLWVVGYQLSFHPKSGANESSRHAQKRGVFSSHTSKGVRQGGLPKILNWAKKGQKMAKKRGGFLVHFLALGSYLGTPFEIRELKIPRKLLDLRSPNPMSFPGNSPWGGSGDPIC